MSNIEAILTISVAANLLGLHPRTIMLYEKEGLIKPYRTATNRRLYSRPDLLDLNFLKYLTQVQGLNLKGVRLILEAMKLADPKGLNLKKVLFPTYKENSII